MNRLDPCRVLNAVADLAALTRTGVLRPLKPKTLLEVGRRVLTEGARPDIVYTLHAAQDPQKPAIVFQGRTVTWRALDERITRLANWLQSSGVRPRDTVALLLPNRPEFVEAQAAAMRIGATAAVMNPRAPDETARELMSRVSATVLVTHRPELGSHITTLVLGDAYEDALSSSDASPPRVPRDARGKIVIFTSGTTGRPKGAVRDLASAATTSALGLLRVIPVRRDDVHLTVCPLHHASGSGFTTMALALGNTVVLADKFSPETFFSLVETHRATSTAVVPTMLHELTAWPNARDFDMRSLRVVVCTGSPLRTRVRDAARDLLGDKVYDLYGATEMGWVSVATPADQRRRPGSVGRPVPGIDVRILDDAGKRVPRGERGQIWAGNAVAMDGYLDDPDLTDERMRGGYVSVGDVGFVDTAGYLHVVDRIDDMIISGGVNVYPAETEIALASHPGVREAAVFGVPDQKWGQRVVSAVVRAAPDVSEADLLDHCKAHAPAAAVPKEIRFTDALPRNDIGKVDKGRLAAAWKEARFP